MKPDEIGRYPVLDLNEPRRRRTFVTLMLPSFVFLFIAKAGPTDTRGTGRRA